MPDSSVHHAMKPVGLLRPIPWLSPYLLRLFRLVRGRRSNGSLRGPRNGLIQDILPHGPNSSGLTPSLLLTLSLLLRHAAGKPTSEMYVLD